MQICRAAGIKIDWYIPKPENFCQLPGKVRLCIIITYFILETSPFFTVSFHPVCDRGEWFSNLDTEDALDLEDKLDSWLLCI